MRVMAYGFAAVVIFSLGVLAGRGDISFNSAGYSSVNPDLPANLDYSSVEQVYDTLRQYYSGDVSTKALLNGLKHGLAEATNDPYTTYFTPSEAGTFKGELDNTFSGIGAQLSNDSQGNLIVETPLSGFPAEKAGLRAKDIIIEIDGKDSTKYSLPEAVKNIRGKVGTKVTLTVIRDHSRQLEFSITRQNIKVPSVTYKVLEGNIGYVQIISFADDTADLMDRAAQKFKSSNVKGVVLDMRNNPGGILGAAVKVSSHWLPQGATVVTEKRGDTVVDSYNSNGTHDLVGVPTVVLLNGGSASAAEITAAALHDNKAAYIIGEKSYGKGVVQQIVDFKDGSQLKVTIASWYRPNGKNISGKGIAPDQKETLTEADAKAGDDPQKQAALDYLLTK